ncbi:hypothetical protein BCR39DRAFT_468094 [Naematelia encephala]|uniref:Glycosyltransferase family 32 protein n=1 Tax=Naematelia encephala TaxID=71784 RepID=A0A1Y2B1B7_9TREE|nr:hypothetical protein BCR39DRAFT_468094 [Naematelia encephala]
MTLDSLAHPSNAASGPSAILNIGDVPSPVILTPSPLINGYNQPPPGYGEATTSSASAYFPTARARRKSLSHIVTAPAPVSTSEDDPDDAYPLGGPPISISISKAKARKKSRGGSFSLPFHRRRRLSNATWNRWWGIGMSRGGGYTLRQYAVFACVIFGLWYAIHIWRSIYEIQVEFSIFSRKWISREIDTIQPLRGCFDPAHMSPSYNLTQHLAPKRQLLTPGISLRRGMSCYDFSSTVQPLTDIEPSHVTYHTYWRSDLIPFGQRQTATITGFLATQPLEHSKLILWTNGADVVSSNPYVKPYLEKWGEYIEVRQIDIPSLTRGTELEGILSAAGGGGLFDERAWVDGDAVRLLVLWHFGGVWMDMDQILTRDLHPLTEQEFVTQWDCYDKPYFSLNGALLHFHRHSPYLCEAFHIMASSPLPKPNTFTWGAHLYSKLHRRLLAGKVKPFTILPWCFTDPRNCRSDIRFPDPFSPDPDQWAGRSWDGRGEVGRSGRELLEEKVGYVWSLHLHNQWRREFPKDGWVERLLDGYRAKVDELERWARSTAGIGDDDDDNDNVGEDL